MSAFGRVSAFYAALFMISAINTAFWPLWMQSRGLTEAMVGSLIATSALIRPITAFGLPYAADHFGAPRLALGLASVGVLLSFVGQAVAGITALPLAYLATGLMMSGLFPLTESMGHAAARREGFLYGAARSVGSAAFIAANLGCGALMTFYGPWSAFWWAIAAAGLMILAAAAYPRAPLVPRAPGLMREALKMLAGREFIAFMLAAALVQAGHATFYSYGSIHWRKLGYGEDLIGVLWGVGVLGEIVFLMTMDRYAPHARARLLMAIGGAAATLRWSVMAVDPPLGVTACVQALHGLTFGAAHLAAMRFIANHAPHRLAHTAQGFYAALFAAPCMAAAQFAAAAMYPRMGAHAYWMGVVLGGLGGLIGLLMLLFWRPPGTGRPN